MKKEEQEGLKNNSNMLINMILSEPEVEPIKKEITKHMDEVKKLACNTH